MSTPAHPPSASLPGTCPGTRELLRLALKVLMAFVLLYALGMTHLVATDDGAELQNLAPGMERLHSPGYPLQMLLGRLAVAVSPLEHHQTITLLSAGASALALACLSVAVALTAGSIAAGATAAVLLGFSHAFWMHGCIPEVYPLNMLFIALAVLLLAVSMRRPALAVRCGVATALILGVGAGNHLTLLMFFAVFGPVYWWWFPATRRPGAVAACVLAGMLGLATIYAVLVVRFTQLAHDPVIPADPAEAMRFALWWASGGPARNELFVFGVGEMLKRLAMGAVYAAYQFPSPAWLLIAAGLLVARRRRALWPMALALGGIAVLTLAYAVNFDSSDVYVFHMPMYLCLAALAGLGLQPLLRHTRHLLHGRRAMGTALAAMVWCNVAVYAITPLLLNAMGVQLSANKGNFYYLWPPKGSYMTPWNQQVEAMLALVEPERDIILANWSSFHLIEYYNQRLPEGEPRRMVVNAERPGSIHIADNWSGIAHRHLLAHPQAAVWSLGVIPALENDSLIRLEDWHGVVVATMPSVARVATLDDGTAVVMPPENPREILRRDFSQRLQRLQETESRAWLLSWLHHPLRPAVRPPHYRPFYDKEGFVMSDRANNPRELIFP